MAKKTPRIAVYKFASCDGCQLSILDLEDELLEVGQRFDIAYFMEVTKAVKKGPYDVGLVEGSITTPHDVELIKTIRKECKKLVTIGACATAGGIQALRNWASVEEFSKYVYAKPEYIQTLEKSSPISEYVQVDLELKGCPVNKYQLLEVLSALIAGRKPNLPTYSVCMECKMKGNVCVAVAKGIPCLGPVVQAGCGALCPSYARGCYGCFGPMESPNVKSIAKKFIELGMDKKDVILKFRGFTGWSKEFREVNGLIEG
ncbi:MAG: oxidoreductase [Nitrososphaerota archaeon]|nr:oxidoreductase [Aigarchaeota archaeon]MDW8076726.1 oxidoreductase [Nitrososphaerota archaeon]